MLKDFLQEVFLQEAFFPGWLFWSMAVFWPPTNLAFSLDDLINEDDHKNEDDLKNEEKLKNEDNFINEDGLKNEDALKNEGDLKNEDNLKNEDSSKNWNDSWIEAAWGVVGRVVNHMHRLWLLLQKLWTKSTNQSTFLLHWI